MGRISETKDHYGIWVGSVRLKKVENGGRTDRMTERLTKLGSALKGYAMDSSRTRRVASEAIVDLVVGFMFFHERCQISAETANHEIVATKIYVKAKGALLLCKRSVGRRKVYENAMPRLSKENRYRQKTVWE